MWPASRILFIPKRLTLLSTSTDSSIGCQVPRPFPLRYVGRQLSEEHNDKPYQSKNRISRYSKKEIWISGLGGFVGMSALSAVHYSVAPGDLTTILASFGATSVIIFGFPESDFAQPKNVIGGHLISALWGICIAQIVTVHLEAPWLAGPTAVMGAMVLMLRNRIMHPPAGGTALIAALGSKELQEMGLSFLIPTTVGSTILVISGILFNNLCKRRSYPKYWF